MPLAHPEPGPVARAASSLTGSHRRALEAIFHHPLAHNLEWTDVVALIREIGVVREQSNSDFVFEVAGRRHIARRPHTKDMTSPELLAVRRFLTQAGYSPEHVAQPAAHPNPPPPALLVVVDHHGTRIFHVDATSDDPSTQVIRPDDPHHFLHHLVHRDQSQERGQRAPEEPAYYESIADALALGGQIVVLGHGTGKSNAAHHLTDYLKSHHRETYRRIVRELTADLSGITSPQLLELARQALRP